MPFNGRYPSGAVTTRANAGVLPRNYRGTITGVMPGDYNGVDNRPEEGAMDNNPFRLAETVDRVFDSAQRVTEARECRYVFRRRVVEFEPSPSG